MKKLSLFLAALIFTLPNIASADGDMLTSSEVQWSPLNPARGDKSPQAGQLWGDRTKEGPSGFLVKFADGFSSPPHIHNVTYRGVVIHGLVHNDDPDATNMWMPAGSFWTQPAGESHITAAQGEHNVAYIEIEAGPYLVQHAKEAFDNGERPVNVDPVNLVWLSGGDIDWIDEDSGAKTAFLWGKTTDGNLRGNFIKLPAGFSGMITPSGSEFRAVIVKGEVQHKDAPLNAGSYFGSAENEEHKITADEETILYIRSNANFRVSHNE